MPALSCRDAHFGGGQGYRVGGLVVLAVTGDHEDTVQAFRLRLGTKLSFPILIDRQAKAVRDWSIKGLPTTFIFYQIQLDWVE